MVIQAQLLAPQGLLAFLPGGKESKHGGTLLGSSHIALGQAQPLSGVRNKLPRRKQQVRPAETITSVSR